LIKTPKLKVLQPKKVSQKHTDLFSFEGCP
jgi:hypothetical protein